MDLQNVFNNLHDSTRKKVESLNRLSNLFSNEKYKLKLSPNQIAFLYRLLVKTPRKKLIKLMTKNADYENGAMILGAKNWKNDLANMSDNTLDELRPKIEDLKKHADQGIIDELQKEFENIKEDK